MRNYDPRNIRVVNLKAAAAQPPAPTPTVFHAECSPVDFDIIKAEANAPAKVKSFSVVAYTGGAMRPSNWYYREPIVVDLEGMADPRQTLPIDAEHSTIIGHSTAIEKTAQRVKASGVFSAYSETEQTPMAQTAREVVRLASNGFPWQASMEFEVNRLEKVEQGQSIKVNGRNFDGPLYVARASTLRRISFVANGADGNTSANVAASANKGAGVIMNELLKTWLQSKSIDPATVAEPMVPVFQAQYDAELKAKAPPPVEPPVDPMKAIETQRAAYAAEANRVNEIRKICASFKNPSVKVGDKEVALEAHAIASGLDWKETKLMALEASSPVPAPMGIVKGSERPEIMGDVFTAALCRSRQINVEKMFKPEVLEASDRYRNLGLQQVILECAGQNGYAVGRGTRIDNSNLSAIMRAAFGTLKAGFSSVSLPGILGAVANKELEAGYMQEDQTWREIAKIGSVSNFHQQTVYRMLDDMEAEELGNGGEIKHGKVDSESFTRQAKTYAKMFTLTRKSIINDDLGAFDDLRTRMGRGQAKKLRKVFWTEFMSDASNFWTTARTNYITGATTTLLVDGVGLGLGVKAFRQMTSPTADGNKRIGGQPSLLLVPPELEAAARVLYTERGGFALATAGNANPWQALAKPICAVELSDSNYTGYSTTAWYLLRNPSELATVHVTFLNGQEMPTVESADTEFNTLGVQFRVYHDFGCDQAEYLSGVKSKGAA